jgi:hypothetical protein
MRGRRPWCSPFENPERWGSLANCIGPSGGGELHRSFVGVARFASDSASQDDSEAQISVKGVRTEPPPSAGPGQALSLPKGVSVPHGRRCAPLNSRGASSHMVCVPFQSTSHNRTSRLLSVKSRGHVFPLSFFP